MPNLLCSKRGRFFHLQHLKAAVAHFIGIGEDDFGRWQAVADATRLRANIVRYSDGRGPHAFVIVRPTWDAMVHATGLDALQFIPDVKPILVLDAEETYNEGYGILSNIAVWSTGGRTLETGVILRDGSAWSAAKNLKRAFKALERNRTRLRDYHRDLEVLANIKL